MWEESQFEDTAVIFEGKRTPFVKKKIISKKETNMIATGLFCEYDSILFVACKDGSIRNLPFNPDKGMDSSVKVAKWEPHRQVMVR